MDPWRRIRATHLERCRVFDVERVDFSPPDGVGQHSFFCIRAPDWINVVPLTADGEVLLLRQYRFGVEDFTLEIPGGMCDPGETAAEAARRELREETGYDCAELVELGWVYPNPALQDNRCTTFLASGVVEAGAATPDPHEEFELQKVPLTTIPQLIRSGKITHSLVVTAFALLELDRASRP